MDTETTPLARDEQPVCSICIANYNGKLVLEACLDSVFQQDFSPTIEVIVHDDASTDGSADIVNKKFPSVQLIRSERNVGFCVSNNRMVAMAKGRFILLLNNDAELHKDAISTLFNYAVKGPESGIIGLPQYDMQTGDLIDMGSLFDLFLNPIPNRSKDLHNVGMVIGACMWFPKKLWNELGGFPEWFENLAEDMYLCCLARLQGYSVIALSESGFKHWVGRSFGGGKVIQSKLQTTYRRRALSERNKSYVMFLCYPAPFAYILIPLHLLLLTIEGLVISFVKKDWHVWSRIYKFCLKSLWCKRKELARLRREIQKERTISPGSFYAVHSMMPHKLTMFLRHGLPSIK